MRIPLRTIIGFGAGVTAMALVLLAGLTAPRAAPVQQASARCPDSGHEIPLALPEEGAESPA